MSAVLGVSTLLYLPYAVFNIASPLLSVVYGATGLTIEKVEPSGVAVGADDLARTDPAREEP